MKLTFGFSATNDTCVGTVDPAVAAIVGVFFLEFSNLVGVLVVKFWIIQIGAKTIHVKHHCCQSLETKFTIDLSTTSTIGVQCTIQGIDP